MIISCFCLLFWLALNITLIVFLSLYTISALSHNHFTIDYVQTEQGDTKRKFDTDVQSDLTHDRANLHALE
ncbi:hypothetical protein BT93_L2452 [Corymbia citriodora subsp. variegata]|uniref:Uncharacterized protein n=1 Tax=Corymbia citriodora subsp. variegata TaxID=360336 RepID=A0A8T0CJV6_CORYI|nr:hypothetical protein BT93_L2452 [Corymbia citriodora subsp. variegata]